MSLGKTDASQQRKRNLFPKQRLSASYYLSPWNHNIEDFAATASTHCKEARGAIWLPAFFITHSSSRGSGGVRGKMASGWLWVFFSIHSHLIKQSITLKFKNNISLVTRKIGGYMSFFLPGAKGLIIWVQISLESPKPANFFSLAFFRRIHWSETKTVCLSGSPMGAAWPRPVWHQRGG